MGCLSLSRDKYLCIRGRRRYYSYYYNVPALSLCLIPKCQLSFIQLLKPGRMLLTHHLDKYEMMTKLVIDSRDVNFLFFLLPPSTPYFTRPSTHNMSNIFSWHWHPVVVSWCVWPFQDSGSSAVSRLPKLLLIHNPSTHSSFFLILHWNETWNEISALVSYFALYTC